MYIYYVGVNIKIICLNKEKKREKILVKKNKIKNIF